jgi:hypothetical protein
MGAKKYNGSSAIVSYEKVHLPLQAVPHMQHNQALLIAGYNKSPTTPGPKDAIFSGSPREPTFTACTSKKSKKIMPKG